MTDASKDGEDGNILSPKLGEGELKQNQKLHLASSKSQDPHDPFCNLGDNDGDQELLVDED